MPKREAKLTLWVTKLGHDTIAEMAKEEERSISDMGRLLLAEAVAARAKVKR